MDVPAVIPVNLNEVSTGETKVDLETIFHSYYERISRVIFRVLRDPARAEELAVEVFLKWEQLPTARRGCAQGWLYRTAVRAALNELRRATRRNRYERMFALVMARKTGIPLPDQLFTAQEEQERVRLVLSAIQPRQAELLLLRGDDLSYEELASTLNLNSASIGTLLSRALEAFKAEFIRRYGKERYGK